MSFSLDIRDKTKIRERKTDQNNQSHKCNIHYGNELQEYNYQQRQPIITDEGGDILPSLLKTWPDAVVITNLSGQIKSINAEAEKLLDYSQDELAGEEISILFNDNFHSDSILKALHTCEQRFWTKIQSEEQLQCRRKSGEVFPVRIQVSECGLDEPPVHILHITDCSTELRQKQRIAELERETAYLARHSLMGELATTITHELSQPLTAITNYTAAAKRSWPETDDPKSAEGLEFIAKAGEQAKRTWVMIHRLRKLLQYRGADCAVEDLRDVLDDAIQLATLGATQHGISIQTDISQTPIMVRVDRVQVQILLANLIRNAIDELRVSNGERKMWITLERDNFGRAVCSVADTGPGISPEVYEKIFDPFLTTKPEGLGVGLAVSHRIAEAHGGKLDAENRPEGGAVFRFLMPACEEAA